MAFLQARQLAGPTPSLTNSHQRAALSRGYFYEACYYTQQNENESPHPLAAKHPVDTVHGFFVVTEAGGSLTTRLNGELQPTGVRKAANINNILRGNITTHSKKHRSPVQSSPSPTTQKQPLVLFPPPPVVSVDLASKLTR